MSKHYAVKDGRVPGVYKTWAECKKQVNGYPGAKFKKFGTIEEANHFMGVSQETTSSTIVKDVKTTTEEAVIAPVNDNISLKAYVDGSFSNELGVPSYGVVLLIGDKEEHHNGIVADPSIYSMRNVAGEIEGARQAIMLALERKHKQVTIYHDYIGVARWCVGELGKKRWKTNLKGTKEYQEFYDACKDQIRISFVKVKAHSGNKYNDLADQLAKDAFN